MTEGTRCRTTMGAMPLLLEPTPPPEPTPGCDVCETLARQRGEFTAAGDYSRASDCTVEMGRCTHEARR